MARVTFTQRANKRTVFWKWLTSKKAPVKAGLGSALGKALGATGKTLLKRFGWFLAIDVGGTFAIKIWNIELAPYLRSKGYAIPDVPYDNMTELLASESGGIIRRLWEEIANEPFPDRLPARPAELPPMPPIEMPEGWDQAATAPTETAPRAPKAESSNDGTLALLGLALLFLVAKGK